MKKICVVVNSRANYGRVKSFMNAANLHEGVELQLIVGASALVERFGNVRKTIERDGFTPSYEIHSVIEGNDPVAMAISTGLATIELSSALNMLHPDAVVVVADRFEQIATAISASYMNIPVVHLQGGELTGSIDDSVRHAISKLSHLHFPATKASADRLIRMGEKPDRVHVVGCPAIDLVASVEGELDPEVLNRAGVGGPMVSEADYILVSQHAVTTEFEDAAQQIFETLNACVEVRDRYGVEVVWLWPNVDAGSDSVSKTLRNFRENADSAGFHFYVNFSPEDYVRLMRGSRCIVGNSSSGIREASFLGLPAVNIGSRQTGRERAENVIDVPSNTQEIVEAIIVQLDRGALEPSSLYGDGNAGTRMAEIVATTDFAVTKNFHDV